MAIISISLTSQLLQKLNTFMKTRGYSSRSEVIRDAVRDFLSEYELRNLEQKRVTATITVIRGYEQRDMDERLTRLHHEHDNLVTGNMHIHLGKEYCLEIFIAEGDSDQVLGFISKVRAMRGVDQVKYTMTPLVKKAH